MTNYLVEYILKFEGSCTGYVPTQKAKEEVIYRIKQIMEKVLTVKEYEEWRSGCK